MRIQGVAVRLESAEPSSEVTAQLRSLTGLGPFVVDSVEQCGKDRHDCTFALKRSGMAVGYGSVIELQHRIAGEFEIVSVERHEAGVLSAVTA